MLATQRRLNTIWFLNFIDHNDGTCTIIEHYRSMEKGNIQSKLWFSIQENQKREAISITIGNKEGILGPDTTAQIYTLKVRNQKNIFDYHK